MKEQKREKEIQDGIKLTGKSRGWVIRTLERAREKKERATQHNHQEIKKEKE